MCILYPTILMQQTSLSELVLGLSLRHVSILVTGRWKQTDLKCLIMSHPCSDSAHTFAAISCNTLKQASLWNSKDTYLHVHIWFLNSWIELMKKNNRIPFGGGQIRLWLYMSKSPPPRALRRTWTPADTSPKTATSSFCALDPAGRTPDYGARIKIIKSSRCKKCTSQNARPLYAMSEFS